MNTNGKEAKLVKHIVKAVCKALGDKNVTPLKLKRGKAEGENATLARKAIAQLTCGLNGISPSVVFPAFGNKNSGGVYTLKDGAAKQYAAGGPLKELVDKVQAEIPKNFFASTEGPRANKSDAPVAGPKTRRRQKKRVLKDERTSRQVASPAPRLVPSPGPKTAIKFDQNLLIFLFWKTGVTAAELMAKFNVGLGDVQRAIGEFTMLDVHGDPEVTELVRLVGKIQERSAE